MIGSFLGDFIKGRLRDRFEPEIERGIRLHRAIDAFTDQHPQVTQAASRFRPPLRRYSAILLDVLFDHLLAQSWSNYYHSELEEFSRNILGLLVKNREKLPSQAQQMVIRMHQANSLASYGEVKYLEIAFAHLSQRLTRSNPISEALNPCLQLLPEIQEDFRRFYPELQLFCYNWQTSQQSDN